jgi:hypothetical protein
VSWAYTFAGGTGEPNDPYQIATAEQLTSIGSDPNLLSKHFVLVADIDLDPNLPGGKVFDRAVITYAFTGDFDGGGHSVRHLTIDCLQDVSAGLFCVVGRNGQVRNLTVEGVSITSRADRQVSVGGLAGCNQGWIDRCRSTGTVLSTKRIGCLGGLVGENSGGPWGKRSGIISRCSSRCTVTSDYYTRGMGGLVGWNRDGEPLSHCHCPTTGLNRHCLCSLGQSFRT